MRDKPINLAEDKNKAVDVKFKNLHVLPQVDDQGHFLHVLKTELRPCKSFGRDDYLFHRWFEQSGHLRALLEDKNGKLVVCDYHGIEFCDRG